jgi:AraC family transcriptional activator of pobA
MRRIPTYSLYGELKDSSQADWVHCETIQARSRLHNYEIQPHRHENLFQILHLAGGRAEIVLDGRGSILGGPSIVAIPPMVVHGYTFSPDVEGTVVTLFENRLSHVLRTMGEIESTFRQVQVACLANHPDIAGSIAVDIAALAAEFDGRAPARLGAIEARLALVLVTLHRLKGLPAGHPPGRSERALQHALRFRQLVDREFRAHKPIEEYAHRLGLTPAHLTRICREHLGVSALGVVHERIVLEAKRYLTFTSMSAKEIASALAFEDPSYFTRFFKKKTGIAPLAYRALQRGT